MKERQSNKANDLAAIERRKQKIAAQRVPGDKISKKIFSEVEDIDRGPAIMSFGNGGKVCNYNRLPPRRD